MKKKHFDLSASRKQTKVLLTKYFQKIFMLPELSAPDRERFCQDYQVCRGLLQRSPAS
jgi:hypothetical protein